MFKKVLLTLTLTAMVGVIAAQSLQFGYYDESNTFHAYNNNAQITCNATPNEWGEMLMDAALKNLTGDEIEVIVEKEHIQIVEGTENSFCWGLCYLSTVFVSNPKPLGANAVSDDGALSFHYQVDPTYSGDPTQYLPGTTIVKYYAYPADNVDDRVALTVNFTYSAASVAESTVSMGHAYPNPASTQVNFDFRAYGNENVKVVVYNLLGQEVKSQLVGAYQNRVSIAVDDFQPGIYFCSFLVNDEVVKTEKFIVKR